MSILGYATLLALFALSSGCSRDKAPPPAPSTEIPPIIIDVDPADLSTSLRGRPLQVQVGSGGPTVGDELLAKIESRINLIDAESDTTVRFTTRVMAGATQIRGEPRVIEVVPEDGLDSSWHELRIDIDALQVTPALSLVQFGSSFGIRFHPDSAPVLQRVQLCTDSARLDYRYVRFDFSEALDFVPRPNTVGNAPFALTLGSGRCTLAPNLSNDDISNGFSSSFQFECVEVADVASVILTLKRPLVSESGNLATDYDSGDTLSEVEFELDDSYGDTSGCRFWHGSL